MLMWAAIWGGVLGLLWPGRGTMSQIALGVALGLLAGLTLRRALRAEIQAAAAALRSAAAVELTPTAEVATEAPPPLAATDAPATAAAEESAPVITPPRPDPLSQAWAHARAWLLGGNTIVRAGLLVLFVGLAFLARFAIERELLPPQLRLAGIGLAGIALFSAGWRLRDRGPQRLAYALSLQGGGVAVLYLTVFAAFRLYQFLPAGAAFAALVAVCAFSAVIAMAQNAPAMAFIGFAGGFAAPLLVSTGQGDHVALFGYYLVLGVAIAAIAWARAWRGLNLLGFAATFVVATAWGVLQYRPEHYASTQPFLIGFFLVYLAAAVLYTTRHSLAPRRAVDATLVFGLPLVGFGLQAGLVRGMPYAAAYSALAVAALYLALGLWMARREGGRHEASRWLAECFAALGLGFATLAIPLALDGRWTAAAWAVEGAGVYWLGLRQGRWRARAAGLALQVMAGIAFLGTALGPNAAPWPLAHAPGVGALMLAGAAFAIAAWARRPAAASQGRFAQAFSRFEAGLPSALFWGGFLWLQLALQAEITRAPLDVTGLRAPVFGAALQMHLSLLAWVGAAFLLAPLARADRAQPWPVAATPAWTVLPVLLIGAVFGAFDHPHLFVQGGWLAWPLLLVLHGLLLHRLDRGEPTGWWPLVHAGGVWLAVLLAGNLLLFAVGQWQLWGTAWASVILLVAGTAVLMALCRHAPFDGRASRWPLDRFATAYLWTAAAPLAAGVALGALAVAVHSRGEARPLPYVPLLNPTDLSVALALATVALWLLRVRRTPLPVPAAARDPRWLLAPAALGFVALNTAWLRVAHHMAQVPWAAGPLFDSFLVQAGYSILWTLLALGLMIASFRKGWRRPWMAGATLLAVTLLKLFLIDLSNRGGGERIVVFIAVGLLMLVLGWFAPLPPAVRDDRTERDDRTAPNETVMS